MSETVPEQEQQHRDGDLRAVATLPLGHSGTLRSEVVTHSNHSTSQSTYTFMTRVYTIESALFPEGSSPVAASLRFWVNF